MAMTFLASPVEIRRAIHGLAQQADSLDLAVAFVGKEWSDALPLADLRGRVRVVCWLSSTNTYPWAVGQLMRQRDVMVRQRDGMHAKVYLARGRGAVIGSANLSQAALANSDEAGQVEAAVLIEDPPLIHTISKWFDHLWESDSRPIDKKDLEKACKAWNRKPKREASSRTFTRKRNIAARLDVPVTLPRRLYELARRFRSLDLSEEMQREHDLVRAAGDLNREMRDAIAGELGRWTGHPGKLKPFKQAPIESLSAGFRILFDEARPLEARLNEILQRKLLLPLRIPTLSLLLYWKQPEKYPPFNRKTRTFLADFGLSRRGVSSNSVATFDAWLKYARTLSELLDLPSPGHLDRLVSYYYDHRKRRRKRRT